MSNQESTLTTPSDRNPEQKFELDQGAEPLNNEQTAEAMKVLNQTSFVDKYPTVERRFVDPSVDLQKIGLISFVPAKGATPNENGIYGFAKLRGNYPSPEEASERAEFLIRNVDSYHQIYHTWVGRPFPLTESSDFSQTVDRIDVRQEASAAIREDVRKKREKEQKDIEEIKQREQELLEDVKKEKEDVDDLYTSLRVKKAQLTWTYSETRKKLQQMVGLIAKARRDIEVLDRENPDLKKTYYDKYMEARRKAGLSTNINMEDDSNFMKFLVEDLELPEVDEEYQRLFGDLDIIQEE